MKRWLKSTAFFCLYYSGLEWLFARSIRVRALAILMYHGVCDQAPIPPNINFHIERRVFERQMRALKRRYRVISMSEVVATLRKGEPIKKAIALSFDDGYRNNAQYVAPVMKRLALPFTIFVSTRYVGTASYMPLNEIYWAWSKGDLSFGEMTEMRNQVRSRPTAEIPTILSPVRATSTQISEKSQKSFAMLSWDEIRDLARAGVEFGSHTHSHCNMAVQDEPQQREELLVSKGMLERNLGTPVCLFAYPYGKAEHMSEDSRRNVIDAGFECAISAEYGLVTERSDRFRLPRLGNDPRIWLFTGEVLYQFAKQAFKDICSKPRERSPLEGAQRNSGERSHAFMRSGDNPPA